MPTFGNLLLSRSLYLFIYLFLFHVPFVRHSITFIMAVSWLRRLFACSSEESVWEICFGQVAQGQQVRASSNTTFNNKRISAFPATDLHDFPFHRMGDTYAYLTGINGTKSGLTLLLQTRDGRLFHCLQFITHQSSGHLSLCSLSYIMRPWIYNRWTQFFFHCITLPVSR